MKRRAFFGTTLAGLPVTGAFAAPPKPRSWDVPTTTLGRTGVKVQVIAQGDRWDTVMMPVHAADHAYLSFEQIALPVAVERGVPTQAIKIFGKANLLRSLN